MSLEFEVIAERALNKNYTRSPLAYVACGMCALGSCRDSARAPSGPVIELSVDGVGHPIVVENVTPLATVVEAPPSAWLEVIGEAPGNRSLDLDTPETTYPNTEVRLYVDRGGVALGVFPPVTADMTPMTAALARQPIVSLTSLATVRILTRPSPMPPLTVELGGRDYVMSSAQLRSLQYTTAETMRAEGWALADVIALVDRAYEPHGVRLVASGGELTLDLGVLRDPKQRLVLKPNQHGQYVFRMWAGNGHVPTRELRDVTKIVVD